MSVPHPAYPGEREYITVPCRKCAACKKAYVNEWTLRLINEASSQGRHYFVTLTYEHEQDDYRPDHIKNYLKSIRKKLERKYGNNSIHIRYFIVGERGDLNNRVHYHGIIYTDTFQDISEILDSFWSHGFTYFGTVSGKSCAYVAKYIVPLDGCSSFKRMSTRPGIGYVRLSDAVIRSYSLNPRLYITENGFKRSLPRYYKKKLQEHAIVFPRPDPRRDIDSLAAYEEKYSDYDRLQFWSGGKSYREQQFENEERIYNKKRKGL